MKRRIAVSRGRGGDGVPGEFPERETIKCICGENVIQSDAYVAFYGTRDVVL